MTKAKGHILPFFIPHAGCPQRCVFCDQKVISGRTRPPLRDEIMKVMAENRAHPCQLAFYGGSFTAIPKEEQLFYLEIGAVGMERGWIDGIRISTRPDAVCEEVLRRLSVFGVQTVELGVQSMDDDVLKRCKRGHSSKDSLRALRRLQETGFETGVQLMPGLPGETAAGALRGAAEILALHPKFLRIYPTVVVEGTELARLYRQKKYRPLSLEQAVSLSLALLLLAEKHDVRVIRMGLNPDPTLEQKVLAGPYHPAFGHLVKSDLWRRRFLWALDYFLERHSRNELAAVYADRSRMPMIFGQNGSNRAAYEERLGRRPKVKSFPRELVVSDKEAILLQSIDGHWTKVLPTMTDPDCLRELYRLFNATCCEDKFMVK